MFLSQRTLEDLGSLFWGAQRLDKELQARKKSADNWRIHLLRVYTVYWLRVEV